MMKKLSVYLIFLLCIPCFPGRLPLTRAEDAPGISNVQIPAKDQSAAASPSSVFAPEPDWVAPIYVYAEDLLRKTPPAFPPPQGRQDALVLLDGPLHLEMADRFKSTYDFFIRRMTRAIESIENAKVEQGARIWKMYNHGFVVKTPSVTIGFDIIRGWDSRDNPGSCMGISPELAGRLLNLIDILAVSHFHGDHFDKEIIRLFLEQKKPVILPPDAASQLQPNPLILVPRKADDPDPMQKNPEKPLSLFLLNLQNGKTLEYAVYPGHQGGDAINNITFFRTPENLLFMHTGDQAGDMDWSFFDRVKDFCKVDVLMVNCWTSDIWRMIRGVNPRGTLTGHEVEMRHTPDHREAFWRSFQIFRDQTNTPVQILFWGEDVLYLNKK